VDETGIKSVTGYKKFKEYCAVKGEDEEKPTTTE
jgi:hypothetical protein